ncbi:NAD-dependent epimerase/dehydratase family protein [Legionella waltersii]|uniref:NAD dependent epimerase/dehydratase family protein n=1 Tax=Legionella waltersii TaxID=66969 RepID=A0A0W1A4J4_9GAMM|nr:NAD-dependent epimerase/dehydratase family protein [Legionella waltersii]KTD76284.1 NAD dependent epimerase/dehydratase family protein [Legionella waltersii]SNV13410.1 NAD dependent epimerase/dehydratase family protein [Legionella waltersii]
MKNRKVLVTGGMGFIGNHLVHRLLNLGAQVWVLDKSIYKPVFHDVDKAIIVEGDVLSRELVSECLHDIDYCFHLAATASVVTCNNDWIFSHENNVLAFNGLLDAIRKTNRPIKLVYASSAAVYGTSTDLPLKESIHVEPMSAYGADKLSNEIYAKVMSNVHHVHSVGLRLFNVYGPGQLSRNPYSGVISRFKRMLHNNMPIVIYGDGLQGRDFIFVNDVVNAFIQAAKTPYELTGIWNVCTGKEISILQLAEAMMKLMKRKSQICYAEARVGDLYHSVGDPKKAKSELGFAAETSLDEGLSAYITSIDLD